MGNICRLVGLKNSELLAGLSKLVQRSNAITAEELAHLAEIDDRMLHLELGFASLFAYCVEALGMSEGSAGRRVAAARVCRRFPEAFERVARGDLHLSAVCALSPHLNAENARELFEACRHKTRRQVEALLAARFPRPDVREQIRRLPVRSHEAAGANPLGIWANHGPELFEAPHERTRQGELPPARPEAPRPREIEALSVDRFGVHFTADAALRELIERARALSRHRLPTGDLSSLIRLALDALVQREEKRRFRVGSRPRKVRGDARPVGTPPTPPTPPGGASREPPARQLTLPTRLSRTKKRSRYVSASVTREVYLRDQGQCSFVSADGRRCGARSFLELDHIQPWAALGAPVAENIRLLCRAHNLLHARKCFGKRHIAARIAARRADDSDERTAR